MNELIENLPSILMGIYVFFKEVGKTKPDETSDSHSKFEERLAKLEEENDHLREQVSFIKGQLSNRK